MILGVDVGGTFTDLFLWDGRSVRTAKLPTTTSDQSEAVLEGASELTEHVEVFLHGTTAATNALLERTGARTVLVTSPGFEDVIEIGRQDRPSLYDPFADRPEPLVERGDRVSNLEDVDVDGIEAIAVSLLRSYEDPSQEQEIGREAARLAPEAAVSLSSDVALYGGFDATETLGEVVNLERFPRRDQIGELELGAEGIGGRGGDDGVGGDGLAGGDGRLGRGSGVLLEGQDELL